MALSFGEQLATSSVSTLGSQIFGSSQVTTALKKEDDVIMLKSRTRSLSALDYLRKSNKETEERESPLEPVPSFTDKNMEEVSISAEHIAELELKAREKYIQLTKEHQNLRRSGLEEDSPQMKHSQKLLRDCYAEIEYLECLGEEASNGGNTGGSKMLKSFRGRDPFKSHHVDVDEETGKARDAYAYAMMCHQSLVARRVSTASREWIESQEKVNETLANLQYWEGRSAFDLPPSI